jgi:surface protein
LIDDLINGQQFADCSNLDLSKVKDILDTNYLTSTYYLFRNDTFLNINLINNWNVSNITSTRFMFDNATNFNQPIGNWNVSKVTNMGAMFLYATAFNQDINGWDTSQVTTFSQMFNSQLTSSLFNQPLSGWNTSACTNMSAMFYVHPSFNQYISTWDTSQVTAFSQMFQQAAVFNNGLASGVTGTLAWNTSACTSMSSMFNGAKAFNQDIGNWNVSSVTNMANMFNNATAFNQNIGTWNVRAVTNFTNFMLGKTPATFSVSNLDAIYNGWINNSLNVNLSISFGTAKHTSASTEGKALLTRPATGVLISNVSTIMTTMIVTTSTAHNMVTGNKIFITGVDPEDVNGLWTVNYISPVQLELQGSVFTSYFDGGFVGTGCGWTIVDGGI